MLIEIPNELNLEKSLNFCKSIDECTGEENYTYDYKNMGNIEPFGVLVVGSKIRNFLEKNNNSIHTDINFENKTYAGNIGFFYSVRQEFGKRPEQLKGNNNFIPIKKINLKNSYSECLYNNMDIYYYIEKQVAEHLADVLSRHNNNLKLCLTYCITEVIRNIYDHSSSKELWYCGQYWPTRDLVEVAIIDEGVGIFKTLSRNKKLVVNNDEEALALALSAGISKKRSKSSESYDIYSNAGFGLYMIKNICKLGGEIAICSKSACLNIKENSNEYIDTNFEGTAIRIRINPSKIPKMQDFLKKLALEGDKESKKLNNLKEISIKDIQL